MFDKNYLWGTASSSYQIEGAFTEDGKGLSIWDTFSNKPGNIALDENGNKSCDHYHCFCFVFVFSGISLFNFIVTNIS